MTWIACIARSLFRVTPGFRHILLVLAGIIGLGGMAFGQGNFQSNASGNWSVAGTWTLVSGADADGIPDADDNVEIVSGHSVIVNAASACLNLTITSGTVDARGFNFTVNGATSVSGTLTFTTSAAGTKLFIGTVTVNPGGTWSNVINEGFTLRGGIVNNGTFSGGTAGTYAFNTNSQTLAGSQPITFPAVVSITGAITVTNQTIVTVGTNLTGSVAGSTWLNDVGSTLNVAGALLTTGTLNAVANPNTVNYNGTAAANQTIKGTTYHHLSVTRGASNLALINATTIVNGNLSVASGTLSLRGTDVAINGVTDISGTLTLTTSAVGTKTFVGAVTINIGGSWTNTINEGVTLQGGLTHNGTTFTAGTGIYTFDTNAQAIGGSTAIAIPNITVTGVSLTNNGTLTTTTSLAGTGEFINGTGSTLNINFTGTPGITTLTASSAGNTVSYGFAGAQTIKVPTASTYRHLTLASSGAKTAGGALTVNGDLTLGGTATFNGGTSLTHTFLGNWVVNTTAATPFAFTTASTVNFETPSIPAQTSLGGTTTATLAFNNINVNNTSGFALNENITASGTVSVNGGATLIPGAANTVGGAGTLTGSGTVKVTRTTAIADFLNQYTITTKTLTNLTVDYDATAAQTVNALNYFNLTIQGVRTTASVTMETGTTGVSGVFNPSASFTSGGYIVTGNTVDFNGGGAQIVPAFNYNDLTLSNTGTKTFAAGTEGIAGVFTVGGTAIADATSNPTTVDYNGAGQTILAINYNHLTLSNSGIKTFGVGTTGIAGNISINGTATVDATTNSSVIDYNGGGAQSVAAVDYFSLTFSNAGTKTLAAGTTRVGGVFTATGTAIADATTNSTTVEFNGTVNQTSPVVTYHNLVINNSGAPGRVNVYNVTVNNDFTVLDGRGQVVGQNFTVIGTTTLSNGAFWVTGTGGTKTFGDIVINSGGLINVTVAENLTVNGSLQVNTGGSITSGAGLWTFQKPAGGTLSGTAASVSITNATFTTDYSNASTFVFGGLDVSGATLTNNGSITASASLTGSGTLTQGSAASLDLGFLGSFTLSTLNASASGNTVSYSAAGAQTVAAIDYANLTLSGSGIKSVSSGTTRISGNLTLGGTAAVDATTNSTTIEYNGTAGQTALALDYHNLAFATSGTKAFASGTTRIAGTFDITGSAAGDATTNNPTIEFNGSSAQPVEALSYYGLTVNNANGLTLEGNVTITNALTLTNGNVTTGANVVIMSSTGSVSRTSGHVVGNLRKFVPTGAPTPTFEVGDATVYAPINLSFASVSVAGDFTASSTSGDHPQILTSSIDAAKSVNRYWTLTNGGVTFSTYDVTFNFVAGDIDGSANTANFILDRYNGGTWTPPTVGTLTPTSSQALGVTADGDFQIGELSLAVLKTWDGGASTNNWGDGNNWNPNGVPTSLNNVSLTGANTIDIDVTALVNSITFNNPSLVVTILSGNSLSASGDLLLNNGTVNTQAAFPAVTGTVSITGGTFGYTAPGGQTIALQAYHHLDLSGSGTKTFSSGTTGIAGDLTTGGSATADATTNATTIDYKGGGAQAVGAINYTNLILSNAGTKTFGAGTVGIAGSVSVTGSAAADATSNGTTVNYNGSSGQTVGALNYHHLTLSNAGTKALAAGTTGIAGNLTIGGTAAADATTNPTTVDYNGSGAQTVGAINYTHLTLSNAGTKTFAVGTTGIAGNLTISGSATVDATTNSTTVDYNGSGSQSIGAINYANLILSNAGTKTFVAGTTGIAGSLSVTGLATADATSNVTTIDYNGSGTQSIAQIDYNHLALSNTGAKQFVAGTTNIFGDATVTGSATLDATTNTTAVVFTGPGAQAVPAGDYTALTFANAGTKTLGSGTTRISGIFSLAGSAVADLTANNTTVEFNGSANQDAPGIAYYNLVASNTGARLLVSNVTVNNNFTVQVGQARVAGTNFTVLGTSTLNGEFRVTATGGAKTLGSVIVNTSGTINFIAAEDLTINGDFQVNGSGTVTSNTGLWTFQKSGGGTFSGTALSVSITNASVTTAYTNSGSYTFADLAVIGTTFTNSGTVSITNSLSGTGTFAQGSGGTLNYNTASAMGVSGFTASASANTVRYGAAGAQSIFVTDYHHLTLTGGGTKTFGSGTTRIAGTFDVIGGAVADATTNSPTVEFNGTSSQAVYGLSYYNVTINNANGVTLDGTLTVTNTLTLTNGVVTTGTDILRIGASGSVLRTSGHVAGNFAKTIGTGSPSETYQIGDAIGNYTPVTVAFVNVTVSGELTMSTTAGDHPEILTSGIEPSKTVNRYWTLGASGITYSTYDVTMNFVGGDVDGGANTANFIIGRYESATWNLPTVGTLTSTSSQATGVVGFGDFQIGEQTTAVLKTWDGGAATNNWGDGNNW
ncbi:MAG TPA: hypothetical protein VJN65_05205, partial [Bacteroidota bacterium]|nr:hypothetical protein [Bacteroidota bacterium]